MLRHKLIRLLSASFVGMVLIIGIIAFRQNRADCIPTSSTEQDVVQALSIGDDIFLTPQWREDHGKSDESVGVEWFNFDKKIFVNTDYWVFNCGYQVEDLAWLHSSIHIASRLNYFEPYTQTLTCKAGSLTLSHYDGMFINKPYEILYWVEQLSDTRLRNIFMAFPVEHTDEMYAYAAQIYPTLNACDDDDRISDWLQRLT